LPFDLPISPILNRRRTEKSPATMAQMRGQGSYGIGAPTSFGGPVDDTTEQSALDTIRQQTSKIEDLLDSLSEPIKPYVLPLGVCIAIAGIAD